MIAEICQPVRVDDTELALEAITDVGPGGHFFGAAHTLERFETAFYQPLVFSRTSYEQWVEEGEQTAAERASSVCQRVLSDYKKPPIDDEIESAMSEYVERRIAEGGAAPD